ncbi:MAG: site-specific integrase [Chitinophagaceae bacterium]|nr:site-specific integrase [Chitinophagaceae bacterium]
MKQLKVHVAVIIDRRRPKSDGTLPLKLRITFNRERKYYNIGYDISLADWAKYLAGNYRGALKDLRTQIVEFENGANQVIRDIERSDEQFSFRRFEELFFEPKPIVKNALELMAEYCEALKANGKISSADSYNTARNSLIEFYGKDKLDFKEITPALLDKYQKWAIAKGKSHATIGIYLRNLRTVFNLAKTRGVIDASIYPFGRGKFIIPTSNARDIGLSRGAITMLYNYVPGNNLNEAMSKDLWFFMYMCNGMNVKDMCRLKFKDIVQDSIVFVRAKTEGTSKSIKQIVVPMNEYVWAIIEKWGNKERIPEQYIFPFFTKGISAEDERRISQNLTGVINDWMNRIAKKLNLGVTVTTYSARHSHSNILNMSGAPTKLIADNLGHRSITTTEKHYLASFDEEEKRRYSKNLLFFREDNQE